VGRGANVSETQRAALALCEQIQWNGVQYRRDIGYRAIERERS
jgi:phosphoribosylamine--glycine ligase